MTRIEIAAEVAADFERILEHLFQHEVDDAHARLRDIITAIDVLETNPHIGRPAPGNKRELIIGRRSRGYVALYRYVPEIDTVFILAIRSQREAGYKHG
jgi:toxin ParE1/3/4